MTREEKLLKAVNQEARGIEIGPSHNPVAPKRMGFRVSIIDTLSRDGLVEKYKSHGVNLDNIEEVDYVWRGERYPDLIGERNSFGWILASHVIEHSPDIVAFLRDCEDMLDSNGVLSLAVPDKRFCFDHFRPASGLANVLDSHFAKRVNHTSGSIVEFMINAVSKGGQIAWSADQPGDFKFLCGTDEVLAHLRQSLEAPVNLDVHAWCFTPASFRLLIHDLNLLGLTTLRPILSFPTEGHEFFVTLGKTSAVPNEDRLELVRAVASEE